MNDSRRSIRRRGAAQAVIDGAAKVGVGNWRDGNFCMPLRIQGAQHGKQVGRGLIRVTSRA